MITREDNLKEIVKHYQLYGFIPQDQQGKIMKIIETVIALEGVISKRELPKRKIICHNKTKHISESDYHKTVGFNEGVDYAVSALAGRIEGLREILIALYHNGVMGTMDKTDYYIEQAMNDFRTHLLGKGE